MPLSSHILKDIKNCQEKIFDLSRYSKDPATRLNTNQFEGRYEEDDFYLIIKVVFSKCNIGGVIVGQHSSLSSCDDSVSNRDGIECFVSEEKMNEALQRRDRFLEKISALGNEPLSTSHF